MHALRPPMPTLPTLSQTRRRRRRAAAVARASICFTVQRDAHLARMAVHTHALNGCQLGGERDVNVGVT